MQPETIRHYLSLGFVPDADVAARYLQSLLGALGHKDGNPGELLVEILSDLSAGFSDLAIPLTAGNDSRGLLGAALQLFGPHRIHCFTFGPEHSEDVQGARAACRRASVEHLVIDPNGIEWSMPAIQRETKRRLSFGLGLAPIDGVAVFTGLAAAIPQGLPVLSGFLGDAVSGKHLAGDRSDNDPQRALARFYRHNAVLLDERPDSLFRDFLHSQEHLKRDWPALTTFDLLDLGFRQRLRIRSAATAAFALAICPYEDCRWIAYWFSGSLHKRLHQRSYVDCLEREFPSLFPPQSRGRLRRWVRRRKGQLTRKFLKRRSSEPWVADRGDPRRNCSMAAVLEEACRSFDQRGLATQRAAMKAFDELMREPSRRAFMAAKWYASAEVLARLDDQL